MDIGSVAVVVGAVVSVIVAVSGAAYAKAKGKFQTAVNKVQTLSSLLKKIVEAFEDDNISTEEFKEIVDEAKALLKGE